MRSEVLVESSHATTVIEQFESRSCFSAASTPTEPHRLFETATDVPFYTDHAGRTYSFEIGVPESMGISMTGGNR